MRVLLIVAVAVLWAGSATHAQDSVEPSRARLADSADGVGWPLSDFWPGETERNQRNLEAQEDTARWALWMMLVSSAGTILSAFAFIALLRQITLTRRIGQAELRAYLSIEQVVFGFNEIGEFIMRVSYKNVGQTPAYECLVAAQCVFYYNNSSNKVIKGNLVRFGDLKSSGIIAINSLRGAGDAIKQAGSDAIQIKLFVAIQSTDVFSTHIYAGDYFILETLDDMSRICKRTAFSYPRLNERSVRSIINAAPMPRSRRDA